MDDDLVTIANVRRLVESGAARSVRIAAGLSLGELARAIGVAPSTIFRWERGSRRPRGARAVRYARALEELLGR